MGPEGSAHLISDNQATYPKVENIHVTALTWRWKMPTIFLSGSIKIKRLHMEFVERIAKVVSKNLDIIVGDANGADKLIQTELHRRNYNNVVIYCTDEKPRNNIGQWRINRVRSNSKPGTRAYFTAKDLEMAKVADYGLMLWDSASTGTLNNVIQLLKGGKKSIVYVNKKNMFVTLEQPDDILQLVLVMSPSAQDQAERKVGLRQKISELTHEQFEMSY